MSKFTKALEQAQRERALRAQPPAAAPSPAAVVSPPQTAPPRAHFPQPVIVPDPPTAPAPRRSPVPTKRASVVTGEVDSHLVSLVAPASLEAEQYRALRHMIEQRHKDGSLSVIAVSSPGAADGKTTTAINLAGALAQGADVSVLLIEADLRQPSVGRLLGFSDSNGLGLVDAILNPQLELADIVQARPPFNLSLVLAGQMPPSPYEVLQSPRLGILLDQARRQYDYIVMDTTPLAPVQDCRVIARWVDGIIVVVAAHHTPRALLDSALDALDPGKVIGLVFNGYDHLLAGRYAGHYSGYYASPVSRSHRPGALRQVTRRIGSLLRGDRRPAAKGRTRTRGR